MQRHGHVCSQASTGLLTDINAAPLRLSYKALRPLFQSESLGSGTNMEMDHATKAPSRLQGRDTRNAWIDVRCLWSGTAAAHSRSM